VGALCFAQLISDADPDEGFGKLCIGHVTPVGQINGYNWLRFHRGRLLGVFFWVLSQ